MSETRKDGTNKNKDVRNSVQTRKDDTQVWRKKQAWTAAASKGMPPQGWPEKVLLGTEPAGHNAFQTFVHTRHLPE
jgi:hypothetical protein